MIIVVKDCETSSWKIQTKVLIERLLRDDFKEIGSSQLYGSILYLISNFILNVKGDRENIQKVCLKVLKKVLDVKDVDNQILENIMNYVIDLISVFGKDVIPELNIEKLL